MKEWVEYCNALSGPNATMRKINGSEQPFEVKLWSIGNENWSIALINRHPNQTTACTLKLGDWLPDGNFKATVLDGDSPDAYNDIENPHRVIPEKIMLAIKNGVVLLPPHSLSIIGISAKK